MASYKLLPIYLWKIELLVAIAAIVSIVLTLFIYSNFTNDKNIQLAIIRQAEYSLTDTLRRYYAQIKNIPIYVAEMNDLDNLEQRISARFPKSNELSALLVQVNQLAEDNNIHITSFSPKETTKLGIKLHAQNTNTIMNEEFSMTATANYLDFVRFVTDIAKMSRVVELVNLRLIRNEDNVIGITCDLAIFYRSQ